MAIPQNDPLRALTAAEQQPLHRSRARVVRASIGYGGERRCWQ